MGIFNDKSESLKKEAEDCCIQSLDLKTKIERLTSTIENVRSKESLIDSKQPELLPMHFDDLHRGTQDIEMIAKNLSEIELECNNILFEIKMGTLSKAEIKENIKKVKDMKHQIKKMQGVYDIYNNVAQKCNQICETCLLCLETQAD